MRIVISALAGVAIAAALASTANAQGRLSTPFVVPDPCDARVLPAWIDCKAYPFDDRW